MVLHGDNAEDKLVAMQTVRLRKEKIFGCRLQLNLNCFSNARKTGICKLHIILEKSNAG